jgi:hypothetical protein
MNANARNSRMKVINHKNANQNIKNKAKKSHSEYIIQQASNPHSGFRLFYYIDKDRNIVGFIKLKIMKPEHLAKFLKNLYDLVEGKIVYELSIVIFEQFRGKKYASDFLGKIYDQIINQEGAFIYLIDDTENGIGEKLYGSRKTSENFNVYIILNNKNGKYLIGRKTIPIMKPQYLKINNSDQNKSHLLNRTHTRPYGQVHLNRYFIQYPENRPT